MGKTCPTYRMLLEDEIASWEQFRRALRKEDREAFDELMNGVRTRASASSNAARLNPFESMVMAALIELMRKRTGQDPVDEDRIA